MDSTHSHLFIIENDDDDDEGAGEEGDDDDHRSHIPKKAPNWKVPNIKYMIIHTFEDI